MLFTPNNVVATTTPVIEKSIEQKITDEAIKLNYNPTKAVAIANAESSLIPTAKNKTSTASGIYQFIDGTFNAYCVDKYKYAESLKQKNDVDIQIKCAVRMLSEGGESHWSESRHVWGKVI